MQITTIMKKLSLMFALALITVLIGTACSGKSGKKEDNETRATCTTVKEEKMKISDLDGQWFIATVGNEMVKTTGDEKPFLGFNIQDSRIFGYTGCNRVMGGYALDIDKSTLSFENLGSTKMMCPDDAVELKILAAMAQVKHFLYRKCEKGELMILSDESGKEVMSLEKEPKSKTETEIKPDSASSDMPKSDKKSK